MFALLGSLAWGQFAQIAATDDGRQIYFVTTLNERDAGEESAGARVFRLDKGRLERFGPERASWVQVSGDGQSVALITQEAEILGRYAQKLGRAERVLLSRNGRWTLVLATQFVVFEPIPGQPPTVNREAMLVNLETGARTTTARPAVIDESFSPASDGSVLLAVADSDRRIQFGIWRDGVLSPLPAVGGGLVSFLGMSDDASTVLAQRIEISPGGAAPAVPAPELIAINVRAGTVRRMGGMEGVARWILLGMSNDAGLALLTSLGPAGPGPAYAADLRSGVISELALSPGERPIAGR